jgi:hypothetical protein
MGTSPVSMVSLVYVVSLVLLPSILFGQTSNNDQWISSEDFDQSLSSPPGYGGRSGSQAVGSHRTRIQSDRTVLVLDRYVDTSIPDMMHRLHLLTPQRVIPILDRPSHRKLESITCIDQGEMVQSNKPSTSTVRRGGLSTSTKEQPEQSHATKLPIGGA